MGFAQNLIDEVDVDYDDFKKKCRIVELEVHKAIEQEMSGKLSPQCAQRLIDAV